MSKRVTYKDFLILQAVPQQGRAISTTEIVKILDNQGFKITPRTVQRDVKSLAEFFAIQSDNTLDTPGWCWSGSAEKIELPTMELNTALSFKIAQHYLQYFLVANVTRELGAYFLAADKMLQQIDNISAQWDNKIGATSRSMSLIAPKIKPAVLEVIYQALHGNKQIKATYSSTTQEREKYVMHPYGLVAADEMLYLVASLQGDDRDSDDYDGNMQCSQFSQFSLHRFHKIELLDERCQKTDFNIRTYIKEGHFLFAKSQTHSATPVAVTLHIDEDLAEYLSESKLSTTQEITKLRDKVYVLKASVVINEQFKRWILSMGDSLEVIRPRSLEQEIALIIRRCYRRYYS